MNAREFCSISSLEKLLSIDKSDFPKFSSVSQRLKNSDDPLIDVIKDFYGTTVLEKLYCALNSITIPPSCPVCSKMLQFFSIKNGYAKHCSSKCAGRNPETLVNRKATNLRLYGVENTGQSEEKKSKIKNTMFNRYGVNTALQLESTITKGRDHRKVHSEEISKKTKETNLARHGHISNLHSDEGKKKVKSSLLQRYGVEHNSQIPDVKEKKSKQLHSYRRVSEYEEDVYQAIVNLGYEVKIVRSTRSIITPYEIDIYFPDIKVGIECCGSYWHSQPWKPVDYHSMKTDLAEQKGITLIHLFDSEWLLHKEDVLAKLRMYIEQNFNSITEEKVQIDRRWPRYDLSDTHRLIKVSEPRRWYFKDGLDWMEEPKEKLKCREIYDCGVSYWNSKVGSG